MSCPNLRMGDLLADELRITFKPYPAESPDVVNISGTQVAANPASDDLRRYNLFIDGHSIALYSTAHK